MKKFIAGTLLLTLLSSTQVQAESRFLDYLKDYGIPCALSLGAGMLLADKAQTGMAIGTSVCLGTSAVTYLNQRADAKRLNDSDIQRINKMVEDSTSKSVAQKEAKLEVRVKNMEDAQKAQMDELKGVLREVLAERMLKMEGDLRNILTQKLESGELMPTLEKNLREAMKKDIVSTVKEQQKAIVEKCVELTIKEVISKPIGTQDNPTGVE